MTNDYKKEWEEYVASELALLTPVLGALGYSLDAGQPHTAGERYLQQAVTTTSGRKLILLGTHTNGTRVVIKTTENAAGIRELEHERACRALLKEIRFAYQVFHAPEELFFGKRNGRFISIQKFIEQDIPFTERPLEEQFTLALSAFKAQESAHATTYEHMRRTARLFGIMQAADYLRTFNGFTASGPAIEATRARLEAGSERIEQYCGFLTHTDFVPHNFRVVGKNIYLLDAASLRFGNKYEGWARFLNFMELYNPPLTKALVQYVKDNRAAEELESLQLMRLYRLGELLTYYTNWLPKVSGNLQELTEARLTFWTHVLEAQLNGKEVSAEALATYKENRDTLRSEDEKKRQIGLH